MPKITDQQYIETARRMYHKDGEIEIDDDLGTKMVSRATGNPDKGAYVQAWVWVYDDDVKTDKTDVKRKILMDQELILHGCLKN